jgi:hypothetical protein
MMRRGYLQISIFSPEFSPDQFLRWSKERLTSPPECPKSSEKLFPIPTKAMTIISDKLLAYVALVLLLLSNTAKCESAPDKGVRPEVMKELNVFLERVRKGAVFEILIVPQVSYPDVTDPFFDSGPPRLVGSVVAHFKRDLADELLRRLAKPESSGIIETGCGHALVPLMSLSGSSPALSLECEFVDGRFLLRIRDSKEQRLIGDLIYSKETSDWISDRSVAVGAKQS